jgi:hypothetical protein
MATGLLPTNLKFEQDGKCFEVQLFLLNRDQKRITENPVASVSPEVLKEIQKIFSAYKDPTAQTIRYMSPNPESCVSISAAGSTPTSDAVRESARTVFHHLNGASPKAPTVEALDETTQEGRKSLPYFADLTHAQLVAYARKPDLTNVKMTEAYQIYKDVVEFPEKDSADEKRRAMLEWIRIYYLELLKWYQSHDLSKLAERESIDPAKKANYYAAMGVLAFVKIEGVSIERLVEKLINA